MMHRHRPRRAALAAAVTLGAVVLVPGGCEDSSTDPVSRIVSIQLSPSSTVLSYLGASAQITVSVFDGEGNAVTDVLVLWDSSDESVATVSEEGLVTAVGPGTAAITAAVGSLQESVDVAVEQLPHRAAVSPAEVTLGPIGNSRLLTAEVVDEGGSVVPGSHEFNWASSDVGVASVSADGLVTAIGEGTTEVTATTGEVSGASSVTVSVPDPVAAWTVIDQAVTGRILRDVWGTGPDNLFAVGSFETLLRYRGSAWEELPPITTQGLPPALHGVWGSGPANVFAVGSSGTVMHYDGSHWRFVAVPVLRHLLGIWGSGDDDVWVVGHEVILHYDGQTWSESLTPLGHQMRAVWGTAPDNVFAVGTRGAVLHYDGEAWSAVSHGAGDAHFTGVHGTGPDDVVVVGISGVSLHFDGEGWEVRTLPDPERFLLDVQVLQSGEAFAVGASTHTGVDDLVWADGTAVILRFDGSDWEEHSLPPGGLLNAVWTVDSHELVAVGGGGTILRYDGTDWKLEETATRVLGIWANSPTEVHAVGAGNVLRQFDGNAWRSHAGLHTGGSNGFQSVWGSGSTEVLVGGSKEVRNARSYDMLLGRYDGSEWRADPSFPGSSTVRAIWGTASDNVFIASGREIFRYDGHGWGAISPDLGANIHGLWGPSPEQLFAVGAGGSSFRWKGGEWEPLATPTNLRLRGVWGGGTHDVFAVGEAGVILYFDGSSWQEMSSPTDENLWGVWGLSSVDLYAVGDAGTILHFDGQEWGRTASPTSARLRTIWGLESGEIFIGGELRTVLRGER